jgi:1-aminocyclopropane-1-carboxylate deaminase
MHLSFFNHQEIIIEPIVGFGHDFLFIKREDQIHPFVSGNKFRKLKYNVAQLKADGLQGILTFGGAFSNHIAAVAAFGKSAGIKTIGIIRGEELQSQINENPTLKFASENEMEFQFISRENYRLKNEPSFLASLKEKYPEYLIVPEGGTNELAVKGCEEILTKEDAVFDYIVCCVGTGGTISGIINSALPHQKVLGFPALKEDFLQKDISKFARNKNWELIRDYHFGGYGKVSNELVQLINHFHETTKIPLDPIYTGKMVFGVVDLIRKNYFKPHHKILIIHSGGLQGIEGYNRCRKQGQEKINNNV